MSRNEIGDNLVKERIHQMNGLSRRTGKTAVLVQQFFPRPLTNRLRMPPIFETSDCVIGMIEVHKISDLNESVGQINKNVDLFFIGVDNEISRQNPPIPELKKLLPDVEILPYSERRLWSGAISQVLVSLRKNAAEADDFRLLLAGGGPLVPRLTLDLLELGFKCALSAHETNPESWLKDFGVSGMQEPKGKFDVLVGCSPQSVSLDIDALELLKPNGLILDGGIGTLSEKLVAEAQNRKIELFRLDVRAAFEGFIKTALSARENIKTHMGRDVIAGISVVACGVLGRNGDIVIDSISSPRAILGVADGTGRMKSGYTQNEKDKIDRINALIHTNT